MNRLYHYTFPELFTATEPVYDEHFTQWAGPGRDNAAALNPNDLWNAWLLDAIRAIIHDWGVSDRVREYAEQNKHLTKAPKVERQEIIVPKVKQYKFSWSYSSLDAFETCPYRWAEERYYKRVKREDTEATIWGKRVHKSFEDYINTRGVKCAPEDDFAGGMKWAKAVVAASRAGWDVTAEQKIGLSRGHKTCEWWSAWLRVIIDVTMRKGGTVKLLDWKTGKAIKRNETQLLLSCATLAMTNPDLHTFDADYIWLKHDQKTGFKGLSRDEVMAEWEKILTRVMVMEEAVKAEVFPMRRSGLCRAWCPVNSCPHCGG